ncbi:DUF1788 domain-containing protein [Candidatus Bipolaricaulota bacterium]
MKALEQQSLQARFDHLLALIGSERFLKKEGLGNEVPFFICPYPASEAVEFEKMIVGLRKKLEQAGIAVLEINLYDLAIEMLERRGVWERVLEKEPTIAKSELRELLQGLLDTETHLIPAMTGKMAAEPFDVLFITGVGEVFPYIRSHNVLNNLQSKAKDKPTVMLYPGRYAHSLELGASLDLFGRLHDDNYYRAFNIFHCEVRERESK